jgi:GAF domain-containing protein
MMRALSVGQPKVVCGTEHEIAPREQEFLARLGGQVLLMAPLMIRGNPEGLVLLVDSDRTRTFDAEQISLCQGIANVVGNAMENANPTRAWNAAQALEAAYDELKQADQLKDDLLQNLSHEIQTPLLPSLVTSS